MFRWMDVYFIDGSHHSVDVEQNNLSIYNDTWKCSYGCDWYVILAIVNAHWYCFLFPSCHFKVLKIERSMFNKMIWLQSSVVCCFRWYVILSYGFIAGLQKYGYEKKKMTEMRSVSIFGIRDRQKKATVKRFIWNNLLLFKLNVDHMFIVH